MAREFEVDGRRTFGSEARIRRRADFDRVFGRRCRAADALLVVYVDSSPTGVSRMGVSVSKRLGGAVVRNRAKRRVREAFRTHRDRLPAVDMVCVILVTDATVDAYVRSLENLSRTAAGKLRIKLADSGA